MRTQSQLPTGIHKDTKEGRKGVKLSAQQKAYLYPINKPGASAVA